MKIWDLLRLANRNLFRNKLRTFLTVAAIFVGSFTLTMTNGLGDGLRSYVENQIKNIEGDTVVFVRRKIERPEAEPRGDNVPEYKEEQPVQTQPTTEIDPASFAVTLPQMEAALDGIPDIKTITPRYDLDAEYISLDGEKKYRLNLGMISEGVTQKVEAGSSITGRDQIVLPLGLAKTLDPNFENVVGKKATIGYKGSDDLMRTLSLDLVGVATKGFFTLTTSFVDAETAKNIYNSQIKAGDVGKFYSFSIQLASADQAKLTAFKAKLDEKGFSAETFADQQKQIYDGIGIFKMLMSLVAAIALLAASFGIINTLVIAVLERTKEIGLQKALGMGRGKIFAIFSLESILIGFWGALLGIIGAIIVGLIANQIAVRAYASSFEGYSLFVFTIPSMLLVMVIVCTIAFVAGVMPAIRASRLNPIESLRYE
ncbi:MAG: FtsX-like permease family protein [Pyrinomonadaceae bacterium]